MNKIIKKYYPLKISLDKINNLSHFWILSNDWNKLLPFNININGVILNGKYKNYKIIKVITNKTLDWNKYILLYVSLINKNYNPCINENKFLYLLHTYNYLDVLNIKKIIIQNNNIIEYTINYTNKINYNLIWNNDIANNIINKNNHFYLDSFNVNINYEKLKIEINRLIKNRNKYKTIHFHLYNNGGDDIVPAHLILRCLVGKKEKWMKNIIKIQSNKKISEWNCWDEENETSPNYEVVKKLNLDHLPNYETKYNGKIFLHMNKQNGSAVWFFITYLIYSFSNKINRYSKKCYGQIIKYGTIESNQLILLGHSGTTSGDGNTVSVKYNNIEVICPTQQFISSSIKKYDWNRFWINEN